MNALGRLLVLFFLVSMGSTAHAALSPEAYQQLRQRAMHAVSGVVLQDPGGRMQVRIEAVRRGPMRPGNVVVIYYPEDHGQAPYPGPAVSYRRFGPGDRLAIWANGAPDTLHVVHGGIDMIRPGGPGAKSGGCGSCAVDQSTAGAAGWLLLLAPALGWMRRRSSRARNQPGNG